MKRWNLTFVPLFVPLYLSCAAAPAMSGVLDAPAAPSSADSAMFTLSDVYRRLSAGTQGAKRTGAFVTPSAGPASTGYTLDELMALAPAWDETDGATHANVACDKTFWGLRPDSGWGVQVGTRDCPDAPDNLQAETGFESVLLTWDDSDATSYNVYYGTETGVTESNYTSVVTNITTNAYQVSGLTNAVAYYFVVVSIDGMGQSVRSTEVTATPYDGFRVIVDDDGNDTGTVRYNGTDPDLILLSNANCFGGKSWEAAVSAAANLGEGQCGLTDGSQSGAWRLPTRAELAVLRKAKSDTVFSGVQRSSYWSGDSVGASNAWALYLSSDAETNDVEVSDDQSFDAYVWPVRSAP